MNLQCKDRMTQEMLDVLDVVNEDYLKQEFLFCQTKEIMEGKKYEVQNYFKSCRCSIYLD